MPDPLDRLKAALADRYAIERELGAGGMATVYLAEDVKHHREVAIKVLHPELAASLGAERFLREITTTANLHHPHILPLYDSGEAQGFLYYVMPYVEGESLRDRLRREKQLSLDDALGIAREVADALGYAHARGIVHRDIKPENILLEAGHALVADFGIARAVTAAGAEELTATGTAIGTPIYMSPEQASGERDLDGRSDLYSLGCVVYEMLGGEPPYMGATPQAVIAKKLSEPTPRISVLRELVPAALEAALERALAKTPADRFATAQQFVDALTIPSNGITPASGVPAVPGSKRPAWHWVAGLTAVAASVAVGAVLLNGGLSGASSASGEDEIERLVVVPFENRTGDPAAADWAFVASEFITRAIDRSRAVTVVPARRVRDLVREADPTVALTLEEIAHRTGAHFAVAGSFSTSAGRLRFDVELVDAESGNQLVALAPVGGPVDSLETVLTLLTERVTAAVVARLNPELVTSAARGWSSPPSLEVMREMVAIGDLFCRVKWQDVVDQAQPVLQQAPDFAPLLVLVAISYLNLGRPGEADSVLTQIEPLGEQLTTVERLLADMTHGLLYGDRAETTRAVEQAYRIQPSGFGYHAGWNAERSNRFADALERLLATDLESPCRRVWFPKWLIMARVYHMLGRYQDELDVARDGLERFPYVRPLLYFEAIALAGLGRFDAVDSLLDVIKDLPAEPPSYSPGLQTAFIALELKALGHRDAYEAVMDRALAWFTARPASELRFHRARAFYYAERWADADTLFAALSQAAADNVDYRGYRGVALAHLDRLEEAREIDQWLKRLDRPYLSGSATRWRAAIAAAKGNRPAAVQLLQQAIQQGMGLGYNHHRDPEWETLRDYRPYQMLMEPEGLATP